MTIRPVRTVRRAAPTREGAGVHLQRAFGFGDSPELVDPFLLLDDFRNDEPARYQAGFPWHPHRGMETITYVLAGTVAHGDSLKNKGTIGPGDVQWMTAGRGIVHQEMPEGDEQGRMHGFQLWANLPAEQKMGPPRYQEIQAKDIPVVEESGSVIRVVCGSYGDILGPVEGVAAKPLYLDVQLEPQAGKSFAVPASHNTFAYVFEGQGRFGPASSAKPAQNRELVLFGDGDEVLVHAAEEGARFLLCAGAPLKEPVAWRGPIVMNTEEELEQAFRELQDGSFLNPK